VAEASSISFLSRSSSRSNLPSARSFSCAGGMARNGRFDALSSKDLDVECCPVPCRHGEDGHEEDGRGGRGVDEQRRGGDHEDDAVDWGVSLIMWGDLRGDPLSWPKMNHSSRCSGLMPWSDLPMGPRLSFSMLVVSFSRSHLVGSSLMEAVLSLA
jgi:hypothetical protein